MLLPFEETGFRKVRMIEQRVDGFNTPDRNIGGFECRQPVVGVPRLEYRRDDCVQFGDMLVPLSNGREAFVFLQFGMAKRVEQRSEERRVGKECRSRRGPEE